MSDRQAWPSPGRSFHSDLVVVGLVGVWTVVVALGHASGGPGRSAIGLLAVLFAPGYALVSALFPRRRTSAGVFPDSDADRETDTGDVSVVERLLLAAGLSICLVPLIGLGVHVSPWGIRTTTFLGAIGAATVTLAAIGAVRRFSVSTDARFTPRYVGIASEAGGRLGVTGAGSALTILIVVGLLVAAGGMGFAVLDADRGERFTELSLTTEDPDTNESVAGGYPEEIPHGETDTVQVGITNQERETMDYTLVVYLQSFDRSGEVRETARLDVVPVTLEHGESIVLDHEIRPEMTGEDLKLSYHLYTGEPPRHSRPGPDGSYRNTHIWIDVPGTAAAEE